MSNESNITVEQVRAMLDYSPDSGEFRWKSRTREMFPPSTPKCNCDAWNTRYAGKPAGGINKWGYRVISFCGKTYYAHRLAILMVKGRWPHNEVDHINGCRTDNRLSNLREASRGENAQNFKTFSTNTSGYVGVVWSKRRKKWVASIIASGRFFYLGQFDTKEDAYAAYLKAKAELHQFQPTPRGDIADEQAA